MGDGSMHYAMIASEPSCNVCNSPARSIKTLYPTLVRRFSHSAGPGEQAPLGSFVGGWLDGIQHRLTQHVSLAENLLFGDGGGWAGLLHEVANEIN